MTKFSAALLTRIEKAGHFLFAFSLSPISRRPAIVSDLEELRLQLAQVAMVGWFRQ
jgi:hypothetical protein